MLRKKKLKLLIALFFSLLLVHCTNNDEKRLHKELVKRAAELNQSTPVALDQYTRFDSVGVTKENVFQYFYTITYTDNPNALIATKKEEMMLAMDKMYTTDRALQFFVENSVVMEYIYRDRNKNVVDIITIESEKYKNRIQQ